MQIHLIDGTFELFRNYYGAPPSKNAAGREVGAARGLLRSLAAFLRQPGVTHVACAFDHVIESFRNDLFPGYKTGEGMDPELFAQFPLAEDVTAALGIAVWPMVEFEADDALAAGAARYALEADVEKVVICSPDKDLTQCVRGDRVVCFDRMRGNVLNEAGVVAKFGVPPASIPDWLALVGDTADGIPGIERWGAKSAAVVLAKFATLEKIPREFTKWDLPVRGGAALAAALHANLEAAKLYKRLATLRTDVPLRESAADLQWRGPRRKELEALCRDLGEERVPAF